uniref:Uncharacterized protein n=1 Tax=Pyrodinium bahamense TaxID=73915 RepID=A0A7S0A3Q0_9DINO|mmetsp:Transcript_2120/g.5891  ORF Transcript_2120/g.5891 Transcript_2120/m.5891 type:complete len:163 (+) Transcript_2120:107-595(+)
MARSPMAAGAWRPSGKATAEGYRRTPGSNTWCHFAVGTRLGGLCSPASHAAGQADALHAETGVEQHRKVGSVRYIPPAAPVTRRSPVRAPQLGGEAGLRRSLSSPDLLGPRPPSALPTDRTSSSERSGSGPLRRVGSSVVVLSAGVVSGFNGPGGPSVAMNR